MTIDEPAYERRSAAPVIVPARPRKLAKVPFVELAEGRLQGVVSSGSDVSRVYVSSIAAADQRTTPARRTRPHRAPSVRAVRPDAHRPAGEPAAAAARLDDARRTSP